MKGGEVRRKEIGGSSRGWVEGGWMILKRVWIVVLFSWVGCR